MAESMASYLATVALGQPVLKLNDLLIITGSCRWSKQNLVGVRTWDYKIAKISTRQIMNFENC